MHESITNKPNIQSDNKYISQTKIHEYLNGNFVPENSETFIPLSNYLQHVYHTLETHNCHRHTSPLYFSSYYSPIFLKKKLISCTYFLMLF